MQTQHEIAVEQLAVRICLTLHRFNGVPWHSDSIAKQLGAQPEQVNLSLEWLLGKKYIYHNVLHLTQIGLEYVEGLKESTVIGKPGNAIEFKNEATTGMDKHGNQSKLSKAVLSTVEFKHDTISPEEVVMRQDKIVKDKAALAKQLHVSIERIEELIYKSGIGICSKCNEIAIMDSRGGGFKHTRCRKCRRGKKKNAND